MQVISRKVQQQVLDAFRDLNDIERNGRNLTHGDRTYAVQQLMATGHMPSYEALLPLTLSLNQKPYTLDEHKPFAPLFRAETPQNTTVTAGRQIGKSQQLAALGVLRANAGTKAVKQLFITPLYEQIRRFSNNYVRPLINNSPIKSRWCSTATENSVLQRSFRNQSLMLFSFALLDADRIRGISADCLAIDEVQDFDPEMLGVVKETITASKDWGSAMYTGTSKTTDSLLHRLWLQSSQAEWFIPCGSCRTWNIPSKEYHIVDMIGPMRPDISLHNPGTVCFNCRKPIQPAAGHWVHKYPTKRWHSPGYHMPQIIFPLHYGSARKWNELLLKQSGWGNTSQAKFWNEVLGEAHDEGQKIVSETELRAACVLPWKNNDKVPNEQIFKRLGEYKHRILAIDWGGGGKEGLSFTAIAVLGFQDDGSIDCLWGKKLMLGCDHIKEAQECMQWYKKFKCDFVAHDYTGAGEIRETVMLQAKFDPDRIFAIRLVRAGFQNMIVYHPPTPINHHKYYSLDKARSLLFTCNTIRMGKLRFFEWDKESDDNAGLLSDFLALVEQNTETQLGGDVYTIRRNAMFPDDFAQAVNLGCAALWHVNGEWPNFAALSKTATMRHTTLRAAGHGGYGWEQDSDQRGYLGLP